MFPKVSPGELGEHLKCPDPLFKRCGIIAPGVAIRRASSYNIDRLGPDGGRCEPSFTITTQYSTEFVRCCPMFRWVWPELANIGQNRWFLAMFWSMIAKIGRCWADAQLLEKRSTTVGQIFGNLWATAEFGGGRRECVASIISTTSW